MSTEQQEVTLPTPSAQTNALAVVFGNDQKWAGSVLPDAFYPGQPELPTAGTVCCTAITDGFWYTADITTVVGSGELTFVWRGHFVVGWDADAGAYRGLLADNAGLWRPLECELTGTRFTALTGLVPFGETMQRVRYGWDFTDPQRMEFTHERQSAGAGWTLWERNTITPA